MILIVGLGNPGTKYKNTRHNIGFIAVDTISNRYNFVWLFKSKFNADIAIGECEFGKLILCKPNTFMNLSGSAVQQIAAFYKIPLDKIIVIHDDVDLALGRIKHKTDGGAGGHNGLKSIDSLIGSSYQRLRVGIGHPEHKSYDVSDYVLGNFTTKEEEVLTKRLNTLIENLKLLVDKDLEKFKASIAS